MYINTEIEWSSIGEQLSICDLFIGLLPPYAHNLTNRDLVCLVILRVILVVVELFRSYSLRLLSFSALCPSGAYSGPVGIGLIG